VAIKLLGISGSARLASYNTQFLTYSLAEAEKLGAETSLFDVRANRIPLFDQDDEAENGFSESVLALKKAVREADAVLFASPEYNSSFSPLAKSIIDWGSRSNKEGEKNEWSGKVVGLIAASPGAFGGIRGLMQVRQVFTAVGSLVIPQETSLGRAFDGFDESGALKDERTAGFLRAQLSELLRLAGS
jgi:chromate reductase, NAD(P)H dehydrogenase (quinone)